MWVEKLKERSRQIDLALNNSLSPILTPQQEPLPTTPGTLYNIYKRVLPGAISKCVAIGFTKEEAYDWIKKQLKPREENLADGSRQLVFYEPVPQGHPLEKDPYHNDKPTLIEENGNV